MPKKVFAVTNIKLGSGEGEYFEAGSEVDHTKFSKEQLKQLHAEGAVEIRTVDDETAKDSAPAEETNASTENPAGTNPEGSTENE